MKNCSISPENIAPVYRAERLTTRLVFTLLTMALIFNDSSASMADDRPNIVYIMSDDMGYSDLGCYGSEIETPNLNRLADNGLRFTQFYNTARCCPTRASLLTGLYPHQAGIGHMMQDTGQVGYRGELNRNCVTIAEVLKTAGYRTYMTGKWHVTKAVNPKTEDEKQNWPIQRGFDRFYGTIHGAGSFFDPNSLTRDNQLISPYADPEYQPENGYYYTDAISDHAVRFVREHHADLGEQPFFMYVSFTAAHWPMHAREEDIEKYRGKYDGGYDSIRTARYRKMLELGVVEKESTTYFPVDLGSRETEHLDWDIRNMEVYAAMIDRMDHGIGEIVAALKETGQLENTLILFLQDNGGCAEAYGRGATGSPRADAPPLAPLSDDYLQVQMQPTQTRDGYPVRTGKGVMAGPADTYIGYGKAWATVSNTPFREFKHWVHEGGISSPLIAHWPAKVTRTGELEHTPSHLIDLMATAVDIADATYPTTFHDGQPIKPMQGKSLLSAFANQGIDREAIYWEHEGNRAVRAADFKLVAKGAQGPWELYNIAQDRSEQKDIADQHPKTVKQLSELWQAYAERSDVLPLTPYNKPTSENFKKGKLRFALKQDDSLDRNNGPYLIDRGITFTATISEVSDGVLAAQGGVTHGWAAYIQNHKLVFAVTQQGKRTVVTSPTELSGSGEVAAKLAKDGTVTLRWNGKHIASRKLENLLLEQPADGLQIGSDELGNVGDYVAPFKFQGKIENAMITLQK